MSQRVVITRLGKSVNRKEIELHRYGRKGKKVLVLGGIHGHPERQSVEFCDQLIQALIFTNLDCQVLIVPELNPDSTHVEGVQTNANGIDLNRNFPSKNQSLADKEGKNKGGNPLSEPESKIVADLVRKHKPVMIIAIHQKYRCLDYDGPANPRTLRKLSSVFDLPIKKLGACPGSMGSYFGEELDIPVITVEFEYELTPQRISETSRKLADYFGTWRS